MIQPLLIGALNHLLDQADWARRQLAPFAGREARFDIPPWQLAFAVSAEGRFAPAATTAGGAAPDVVVALPAEAPLLALQGLDRLLAAAHVTGNAEFATALSFVLKHLRWDVEEDLSRAVGDIAAHRLVGAAEGLAAWQRQAGRNLAENLAEYLGEEARLLTPRRELTEFAGELATLRERLGALDARIARCNRAPIT